MRRILALAFPLLLAFLLVSRGAEWLSEKWWFAALDQGATWRSYLTWRAGAFAVAAPLWLAMVGLNVRLAWSNSLALRAPLSLLGGAMEGLAIELSPGLRLGRLLVRVAVWTSAWMAGVVAAGRFDLWLLYRNSPRSEGADLNFFLFQLPALQWVLSWLGAAFGLTFLGCLTLYFWLEAIETGPGILRATEAARRHLALLGALIVAWKGADCALDVLSAPVVFGWSESGILGVAELRAGLPLSVAFAWSALPVAALIFGVGSRQNGGTRALMAGAGWLMLATAAPAVAPAVARSLGVGDDAAQRQILARHLAATRRAWGFDAVADTLVSGSSAFAPTVLPAPGQSAPVALWPLSAARRALDARLDKTADPPPRAAQIHLARAGDAFELRAIASARAHQSDAPARQWQAPANGTGPLDWRAAQTLDAVLLSEAARAPETPSNRIGPSPRETAPGVEPSPPFRLTTQPRSNVERASLGACLVLAWRFLNASLARPGPPLGWHLDPVERAQTLAPFVNWNGALAHPVAVESGVGPHVFWIVEGCLTARTFPDSAAQPGSDAWAGINYARQNVTAVFDATSGDSQLYLFDRAEPLARAWSAALPQLFRPIEEMPPAIRAALRPAPAQLNALARVYARYHPAPGDEISAWANRSSEWRALAGDDDAPTPFWQDALLPAPDLLLRQWQLSVYAPSQGLVSSGAAALTCVTGVALAPDGAWQWQQWRPAQTLPLPELATRPEVIINRDLGAQYAPPARIGVFPAFDAMGRAEGFTAFRAQVEPGQSAESPVLTVQAATTGVSTAIAPGNALADQTLNRARDLWSAILAARLAADWPLVARLETQLGRALSASTPNATPTPNATTTLNATATPIATAATNTTAAANATVAPTARRESRSLALPPPERSAQSNVKAPTP